MGLKKRYEYSPLEEIFFPKKIENSQYYEDIDEKKNEKIDINTVKDSLLNHNVSLDVCLKHKDKYLNTKNTNNIQNYFFFYDYRKCIYNIDGKLFIDQNPVKILSDNLKRDDRLNEVDDPQNYNTFMYAYNI
ncbi:conserved Plasmodium protein, unknown function [Plasmodium gallinaceum]|uniref:Uncharacterized protein n=1 Tax=Plasmodium gallinaceum TaxID=5849 RepID=A0A1J1GL60_PLAGA|nr:conserved Plasmodium protein, unknown function [Plasmodium gallinaceum]CRG93089.1 conserved Plasmodium protein, unknown function [Plasmodium gallinaceum]